MPALNEFVGAAVAIAAFLVVTFFSRRRIKPSSQLLADAAAWRDEFRPSMETLEAIFRLAEIGVTAERQRIANEEADTERRKLEREEDARIEREDRRQKYEASLERENQRRRKRWLLEQMNDEERGEIWDIRTSTELISWTEPMRSMSQDQRRRYFIENAPRICSWPLPEHVVTKVMRRLSDADFEPD